MLKIHLSNDAGKILKVLAEIEIEKLNFLNVGDYIVCDDTSYEIVQKCYDIDNKEFYVEVRA